MVSGFLWDTLDEPWRLQNYRRSRGLLARASELFDGTSVATRWGWYLMLLTVKPGRAG